MKGRLQELLENQMATLLTRIDEETYSPSNQESDESPAKRGNVQKQAQPLPELVEEEYEEVSDYGSKGNSGNRYSRSGQDG